MSFLSKTGDRKPNKKAYPQAKGMPFVICGYIWKFVGIVWWKWAQVSLRPAGQRLPLGRSPPPCFYPTSHKFIKLFQNCGAECGAGMPHIRKKDLRSLVSPWFSWRPQGEKLLDGNHIKLLNISIFQQEEYLQIYLLTKNILEDKNVVS